MQAGSVCERISLIILGLFITILFETKEVSFCDIVDINHQCVFEIRAYLIHYVTTLPSVELLLR